MFTTKQICLMMKDFIINSKIKFEKQISDSLNKNKPPNIKQYFGVIITTIDKEFDNLVKEAKKEIKSKE